jgi:hypothetical protein
VGLIFLLRSLNHEDLRHRWQLPFPLASSMPRHCWAGLVLWTCLGLSGVQLSRKIFDSHPHPCQKGRSRSSGYIGSVVGQVQQNLAAPGHHSGDEHQVPSLYVLGVWISTCCQGSSTKSSWSRCPNSMPCAGRDAVWDRYSIDVGAVFNKLFCWDELVYGLSSRKDLPDRPT